MIQLEYKTVGAPAPLSDFDLNRYGEEGWHLCGIIQQTLIYYTFTRPLPVVSVIHRLTPHSKISEGREPHQHEPRASRRDPVVKSGIDPIHDQEGE